jgi:HlyD family secretion protein
MRKGTKLGIAAALGVAVVAVSIITAMTRGADGAEVRIEQVQRRNLVAMVNATGWIRPHRKVDVQADLMGRITELRVTEGQTVARGQILLRIDPLQYEAAVEQSKAAVSEALAREAQARANLLQAERAYERTRQLASGEESLVSIQTLEEAETQLKVQQELLQAAGFSVSQARAALGEAEDRLAKTVIRAPMDGVITRLNVDEGETAIVGTMNNPGSLLLTVSDMSIMEAVVRVDETDVPEVSVGDSASITIDAFPKDRFVGRVTEISHSSVRPPESQTATTGEGQAVDYEIVIRLDEPPPSLRPDLSTSADVVTETRPNVLTIPIIALTVRERGDVEALPQEDPAAEAAAAAATAPQIEDVEGVFVVRNGKAEFVAVRIGVAGQEYFEVVSGLTEQDSVVAGPYEVIRSLEDGSAVRPMATDPARPPGATASTQGATSGD